MWRMRLWGFVTDGYRARWALADCRAHRILQFRWHLTDAHNSVAVVVQFEHFRAEPQADPETGAYTRVDMDFHGEPPAGSNSRLR